MPRDPDTLTPLSLAILMAVTDGPMHGYAIMKALEERDGPRLIAGAGSLYAALDRMVEDGLLRAEADTADARRTRRFRVTARGRHAARAELERMVLMVKEGRARRILPGTA